MATWYAPTNPDDDRLWLYSERGVMSYIFVHLLRERPDLVLDNAVNGCNQTLRQVVGEVAQHRALAEFDLGNRGFGKPDGGLFLRCKDGSSFFVFIEAKREPWAVKHVGPTVRTPDELRDLSVDQVDRICQNEFNSSVNGQLEFRWRFANAVQDALESGADLVVERRSLNELMASDRFYWRRRLVPDDADRRHWRSVAMNADLQPLLKMFTDTKDNFALLAITTDQTRPDMQQVRMLDRQGSKLDDRRRDEVLFWMSLDRFTEQLRPLIAPVC